MCEKLLLRSKITHDRNIQIYKKEMIPLTKEEKISYHKQKIDDDFIKFEITVITQENIELLRIICVI